VIDADEDSLTADGRAYVIDELAVRLQPLLIRLVVLKIAFEQDHARGAQVRQQCTIPLMQLHRGPQSDQEVIAYRADVWVVHLAAMIRVCGLAETDPLQPRNSYKPGRIQPV
jgi:hypothetical protein